MTERPILFSGPMVRALLEGRKTQTRRVIKPQPKVSADEAAVLPQAWEAGFVNVKCPYGKPGDILWVRETWNYYHGLTEAEAVQQAATLAQFERGEVRDIVAAAQSLPAGSGEKRVIYAADFGEWAFDPDSDLKPWKPSIFMPRWASRITLEITGVRAERLQDISEEDAIAEGCNPDDPITDEELESLPTDLLELQSHLGSGHFTAKLNFMMLWDSINGKKRPWASNPWVWVISLRMLDDKGKVQ